MAATNLQISDDRLLAEYVRLEQFQGWIEQRLAIAPDTLGLLIRDGNVVLAAHGANISLGGVWQNIKDAITGRHSLRLLLADLKPFQLTTTIRTVTKDHVEVQGELIIDFQVNPEKPANILGLVKDHSCVLKADVLSLVQPHLDDRVLEAVVGRAGALELRGNTTLQDKVQADIMKEVERITGDLGIIARTVSLKWAFNEDELAAFEKRKKQREQEMLEVDFQILAREIEREGQTTEMRLKGDVSAEKLRAANDSEIRQLVLSQELAFADARDTGTRIQQMKMLEHELALNKAQRLDGLNTELEAAQHAINLAKSAGERAGAEQTADSAARRQQVEVARITEEMRVIQRTTEELDKKSQLELTRLEEFQNLEIADKAHGQQVRTMRDLQELDLDALKRRAEIDTSGQDAVHRRRMEEARQADQTTISRISEMKGLTPEQILAVNAGFSPAVANVLIEQARARAGDDRIALMREMIDAAKEARIASEAQARAFFETGMKSAAGVAERVGVAAGISAAAGAGNSDPVIAAQTVECPECHRTIPVTDRHCRFCGHQMRT